LAPLRLLPTRTEPLDIPIPRTTKRKARNRGVYPQAKEQRMAPHEGLDLEEAKEAFMNHLTAHGYVKVSNDWKQKHEEFTLALKKAW
jgi:hypothetical protein